MRQDIGWTFSCGPEPTRSYRWNKSTGTDFLIERGRNLSSRLPNRKNPHYSRRPSTNPHLLPSSCKKPGRGQAWLELPALQRGQCSVRKICLFPILQHEVCQREGRVLLQASSKQSGEGLAERGAAGISLPWVEQREAWWGSSGAHSAWRRVCVTEHRLALTSHCSFMKAKGFLE